MTGLTDLDGHVTLDGIMFDILLFYPFMVTIGFVRSKASVLTHILDDAVMYVLVKGGIFDFIGCGCINNGIVLCESRQEWFYFYSMYNTRMPHANVMNKVRW